MYIHLGKLCPIALSPVSSKIQGVIGSQYANYLPGCFYAERGCDREDRKTEKGEEDNFH